MSKAAIPLAKARGFAQIIAARLAPYCERIEIAGSIRRKRETVGDIELVAISRRGTNLLGEPTDQQLVDQPLLAMEREGYLGKPTKDGDRYK